MKIIANEFVFPLNNLSCHASQMLLLDNGEVFCVWFEGSKEGNDDVCIFGSLRDKSGKWSKPERLTFDDRIPHWNPVLHRQNNGDVWLFYKVGKTPSNWHTEYMISTDNCNSFKHLGELVPRDISGGRGPVRNKLIIASDGTLLSPASSETDEWFSFIDISEDNGLTWKKSDPIRLNKGSGLAKGKGLIQPTLWESSNGHIHALMRSTEKWIYRADSFDFGKTWSEAYPINMKNNNSGIDLVKIHNGTICLVCNPVCDKGDFSDRRSPISLYFSNDDCKTWSFSMNLATGTGEYSYPCILCDETHLYISYTWNRKLIYFVIVEI